MRHAFRSAMLLVTVAVGSAGAQAKPPAKQGGAPMQMMQLTWADLTGDWVGKSMRGTGDTVITTLTMTFAHDKKVWMKFPDRPPVAARVVAMGGDSVVTESSPYESLTRAGHKVTVRSTSHVRDHKMWGPFRATFDDGQVLNGHTEAAHKLK